MIAYHGDPQIKKDILAQLEAHRLADELIKGRYWEGGKGCAVGCTIHGNDHHEYERRFGIPVYMACLEDAIFEDLPNKHAKHWPERFMSAIQPGVNLNPVWPRMALWMLDNLQAAAKFVLMKKTRRIGEADLMVEEAKAYFYRRVHSPVVVMESNRYENHLGAFSRDPIRARLAGHFVRADLNRDFLWTIGLHLFAYAHEIRGGDLTRIADKFIDLIEECEVPTSREEACQVSP